MAELNLLQGRFTGRLGELSGTTWKGKPVVKAAPFSKAPPTPSQTANVRAFECLNRLSSAIAKAAWVYLGLSAKGLHRHNAVARWLKPAVKNHVFEPQNIKELMYPARDLLLEAYVFNYASGHVLVSLKLGPSYVPRNGVKVLALIFSDAGRVFYCQLHDIGNITIKITLPTTGQEVYSFMAFASTPTAKGYKPYNFIFKRGPGMRYSLDEQLTGDLWIDGRPIYNRVLTGTLNYTASTVNPLVETLLTDVLFCVQISGGIVAPGSSTTVSLLFSGERFVGLSPGESTFNATRQFSTAVNIANELQVTYHNLKPANQSYTYTFNVFYTKKSDQPVVDG
jgi:hypothetical protein